MEAKVHGLVQDLGKLRRKVSYGRPGPAGAFNRGQTSARDQSEWRLGLVAAVAAEDVIAQPVSF